MMAWNRSNGIEFDFSIFNNKSTFETNWPKIKPLVEKSVRTPEDIQVQEFMDLYSLVYKQCLSNWKILFDALTELLRELVTEKVVELGNLQGLEERHHEYNIAYERFKKAAVRIASGFSFFDNAGGITGPKKSTVHDHCMTIWKEEMFDKSYAAIMNSSPVKDVPIEESVHRMKKGLMKHVAYCMTTMSTLQLTTRRGSKEVAKLQSLRSNLKHNAWII
ncbi:hypothetical protein QR680_014748 [Steinernema hermaphroditum]|uniref:Cullin N-terminal domain-containing protein n=1 Tax=Steinernema hermaphroditum TaxID=289476 RepID=A0AA39M4L0_9BILA|nr:hypothetical protein QR680_014748 [Steinernema hermaphroditum]